MPEILVGEYLFRRLKQIGIDTIFGVPGGKCWIIQMTATHADLSLRLRTCFA